MEGQKKEQESKEIKRGDKEKGDSFLFMLTWFRKPTLHRNWLLADEVRLEGL
jgi:hypothetical protein